MFFVIWLDQLFMEGRVTDEFDRRRLLRIIERFYCPETLKEDYSYAGDDVKSIFFVIIFLTHCL